MNLHAHGQFKYDEEASANTSSEDDKEFQNTFALEATETTKDRVTLTQDMTFINKNTIPPSSYCRCRSFVMVHYLFCQKMEALPIKIMMRIAQSTQL